MLNRPLSKYPEFLSKEQKTLRVQISKSGREAPASLPADPTERRKRKMPQTLVFTAFVASPARLERAAFRLGGGRSIQLSYGEKYEIVGPPRNEHRALRRRPLYPAELREHIAAIGG